MFQLCGCGSQPAAPPIILSEALGTSMTSMDENHYRPQHRPSQKNSTREFRSPRKEDLEMFAKLHKLPSMMKENSLRESNLKLRESKSFPDKQSKTITRCKENEEDEIQQITYNTPTSKNHSHQID